MYKSLAGIAGAAMLFMIPAPPADAFAVRHAAGIDADQVNVEQVWHRGRAHRRVYRAPYRYRHAYPRYRAYPYPYAYAPYPYYRSYGPGYYGPGVGVRIGPFGFGVW
jgi:hypothetical protein